MFSSDVALLISKALSVEASTELSHEFHELSQLFQVLSIPDMGTTVHYNPLIYSDPPKLPCVYVCVCVCVRLIKSPKMEINEAE